MAAINFPAGPNTNGDQHSEAGTTWVWSDSPSPGTWTVVREGPLVPAAASAGQVLMGNASNAVTATTISGDATLSSSGVLSLGTYAVENANIADDAVSKNNINPSSMQGKVLTVSGSSGSTTCTWDTAMYNDFYVCSATAYGVSSVTNISIVLTTKVAASVQVSWVQGPASGSFDIHMIAMLLG